MFNYECTNDKNDYIFRLGTVSTVIGSPSVLMSQVYVTLIVDGIMPPVDS